VSVTVRESLLEEQDLVGRASGTLGVGHAALLEDPTAQGWLLEVRTRRPAFLPGVLERACARPAHSRDELLEVLAGAILETYVREEPRLHHAWAKRGKQLSPDQDAELLAKMKSIYEPIARRKGRQIVNGLHQEPARGNGQPAGGPGRTRPVEAAALRRLLRPRNLRGATGRACDPNPASSGPARSHRAR